jgi:hypothetical protein
VTIGSDRFAPGVFRGEVDRRMHVDCMITVACAAIGLGIATAVTPAAAGAICSVFDRACAPTVCSVFDREPCIPEVGFPVGEGLRWTIESAAIDHYPARTIAADTVTAPARKLDTLRAMLDALRGCWVPPAKSEAWAGMEMSVRLAFKRSGDMIAAPFMTYARRDAPASARQSYLDGIRAALERCTPLPFTAGLGDAVAGRPIAVRFIENRILRKTAEQP